MTSLINQNWVFGQRARLDFSTSSPTASATTAIDTLEGCASISDAAGNLLMYTDGQRVWDAANAVVASGLQGNSSSTQSSIIVPVPGNAAQYYVFTADGSTGGNKHFDGRLIDTGTTSWTVTPLSSLMAMPPTTGLSSTEKLTAIQHANCRDFWVLTIVQGQQPPKAGQGAGILRVFLVSPAGVQHVADTPMRDVIYDVGYLKGSGDGRRIAIANRNQVLVYPFDSATGTIDLTGRLDIKVPDIPEHLRISYGVEFSPARELLYYSVVGDSGPSISSTDGYVFQHDLLNPSVASVQVGKHVNAGGRYALGALQLGMDGRIYVAQDGEPFLGVIDKPSVPGTGCNLTFGALGIAPAKCFMGLPNLIPNPCGCGCDEGNCDEAVEDANRTLDRRAGRKAFTIPANGQALPRGCRLAFEQREFAPVFSLHWGDGPQDQFESHDTEVVYIRAWNPFRNLVYRGLKIFNIRVVPNQALPDGDPALQLIPAEIVCFDEIGPCAHVSRDFAFLIQNAIVQNYQITFEYCIEEVAIVTDGDGRAAFDIKVVAS